MSQREQYTKQKLYEEAFNVNYDWEKCLPPKCFQFHNLTCMETNAPISLQMGVMLPFVSACLGPTTRGCFMTRPSVLNLFWLNVAASGVGKSETRKRLVSEPLEYIFSQEDVKLEDFEVSKFTRAGELVQLLLESIPEKFTLCRYIQLIIRKYKVFGYISS